MHLLIMNSDLVPELFELGKNGRGKSKFANNVSAICDNGLVQLHYINEVLQVVDEVIDAK